MSDVGCAEARALPSHIPHPTSHIRHRAFSLLELTIVLAIAVITAGIAIPRYSSSLSRYRVDIAARRMAADIALAQTKARATGQFRNVIFSAAGNGYALPEEAALEPSSSRFRVSLAAEPFVVNLDSATLSDGGNTLTFDGFGQAAQGLTARLSAGGHTRTITVDQLTGGISVATP
jgi:prepilin-type N-terminal cleavage/methylation domain-containing protein